MRKQHICLLILYVYNCKKKPSLFLLTTLFLITTYCKTDHVCKDLNLVQQNIFYLLNSVANCQTITLNASTIKHIAKDMSSLDPIKETISVWK